MPDQPAKIHHVFQIRTFACNIKVGGGKDDLFLTDQWYPPLKICSFAYTIRWYHSFYQEMMLYVLAEPLSKLMNITMGIKAILGYKAYLLNSTW